MLIDEMHFEFELRIDRVASQDRPDFYDNEIDAYINRAIKKFVKARYGTDNPKKTGFETNQERISNLMSLHVKYPVQPALVPMNSGNGIYEVRLKDLAFPYLFLTSARTTIKKDECIETIDYKSWQVDDRKNTFNEPNFEWRRVHATFGKSTLTTNVNQDLFSIYFDTTNFKGEQQFNVTAVHLSYIKIPDRVCLGTYIHIDDKITQAPSFSSIVHCDIHSDFHDEILEYAVMYAAKDIQDQFGFQSSQAVVNNDK